MAQILNELDAKNAAKQTAAKNEILNELKQIPLHKLIADLENADLTEKNTGIEEISALLALPDEHFNILAPIFLAEYEKQTQKINNQLFLSQTLNIRGIAAEDVALAYQGLCSQIDEYLSGSASIQKTTFLKELLGITFNAALSAEGITKRKILIPIEYCREGAKMPTYAHLTDAGMDVFATEEITINPGETKLIPLGIKCAIPMGYELQVRPKSGRSLKSKLRVANAPGTVDAGYRDEIGVIVDNIDPFIKSAEMDENGRLYNVEFGSSITIGAGEKFAQLVLSEVPKAVFYEVETVTNIGEENRGGGFGSTGDK